MPAPTPAPATRAIDASRIQSLVADLSSDQWQVRQDAQDALIALGGDAEPVLKRVAADELADGEVRVRAERALRQIDLDRRLGPTWASLHFHNAPAREVLESLMRQGGIEPHFARDEPTTAAATRPVTIDLDRRPLWEALREVARQTDLCLEPFSDANDGGEADEAANDSDDAAPAPSPAEGSDRPEAVFAVGESSYLRAPSNVCGGVLISAASITSTRWTEEIGGDRPAAADGGALMDVQFQILVEPKLPIAKASPTDFEISQARDEKGQDLLTGENGEVSTSEWPLGHYVVRTLQLPAEPGQRIARLSGNFTYTVEILSGVLSFDVAESDPVVKKLAGRRYEYLGLSKAGDGRYTVRMRIFRDDREDEEWDELRNEFAQAQQPIQLLDARGRPLKLEGPFRVRNEKEQSMLVDGTYTRKTDGADQPGEPARISWKMALETMPVTVPFDFRDLPIP